ncbi:division/cell wall cluster transcriptional repressor MraZ [Luteithermobacter gelatinilyticus]|uniref:division/cell wall cluster transcriptional repressor MraZ n=1 Tax=Luteithermobacter gelatinilyticus TaxID=2582913 RepID=UPI0011058152|nr:division/cell wall cluster transcriptional repressor MraZ [Luteithermobacter gelatinilyticus]
MPKFTSTYTNKVDKKGRVSVPASFRAALPEGSWQGIVVYPSFVHDAIEGCDLAHLDRLADSIDDLAPFSEEHDAFTLSIISSSSRLAFDSEGRIILPQELMEIAGIVDRATFVGRGNTFQIWEPEAFQAELAKAREVARNNRAMLKWKSRLPAGEGQGA